MKSQKIISINISIFFVLFISIFGYNLALARAWWGWSSWSSGWWAIAVVIAWLYYAIMQIRRKKMLAKAQNDLKTALTSDNSWNEQELKKAVEDNFYKYQQAWTNKNLSSMKEYMTNSYYSTALNNLKKLDWKKNILENINLWQLNLISVKDWPEKDGDMFVMEINASMIDYTINEISWDFIESTLKKNEKEDYESYKKRAMSEAWYFVEYWVFMRINWYWLIHDIKQSDSIIKDVIWLSEWELRNILSKEQNTQEVNDTNFYN